MIFFGYARVYKYSSPPEVWGLTDSNYVLLCWYLLLLQKYNSGFRLALIRIWKM